MAWSDAARRAAALARKRKVRGQVTKANDYMGSVRTQSRAIQGLARRGYNPKTGRKVGVKKARKIASHIGDWAND